ncbi:MAG: hypothetical protein WC518_00365 [Patescibacteria group bacterium]
MPNINLLPEDLREKETKELEKLAKQPKVLQVELTEPEKEKLKEVMSDKAKPSFWTKVLGPKDKKTVSGIEAEVPAVAPNESIDILSSAHNQKVSFEKAKKPVSWSGVLGPARSPIRPAESNSNTATFSSQEPLRDKNTVRQEIIKNIELTKRQGQQKVSWWSRIFQPRPRKPELIKLAAAREPEKKIVNNKGGYHQAPMSERSIFDINLIPEELLMIKNRTAAGRVISILLVVIIAGLLVGGLYWFLGLKQTELNKQLAVEEKNLSSLRNRIDGYELQYQNSLAFQDKLLVLRDLLVSHVYWSNFFNLLEKYTLDDIYYTNLTADVSGEFVLPAVASDYQAVAKQIEVLKEARDFVKEVKVDDIKLRFDDRKGVDGVAFKLKIVLADGVLAKR